MAFIDKLGEVAGKVGSIAGDTFDYGKAKGKIVLERGKIKELKEELGAYVYNTLKGGGALDKSRLDEICFELDAHYYTIAQLENEANGSGKDISDAFRVDDVHNSNEYDK